MGKFRTSTLSRKIKKRYQSLNSLDGETKLIVDGYVELQKGDQSVIFLGKNTFEDYAIINRSLGKYSLNHPEVSISRMSEESTRQSEEDETDKYKNYREEVF
ncbi:hypothetical protein M3625_08660 [Paenibacillus sp. MER 78]|nr:hypothetical protein [Paenibacillus sp. MER 78]